MTPDHHVSDQTVSINLFIAVFFLETTLFLNISV